MPLFLELLSVTAIISIHIMRLPDFTPVPLQGNVLMSFMGWSKVAVALVLLPGLVLAEVNEGSDVGLTITQTQVGNTLFYVAYEDHNNPLLWYVKDNLCPGGTVTETATPTATSTVTEAATTMPQNTVTATVTVTHSAQPEPTCSTSSVHNNKFCTVKHGVSMGISYIFSSTLNLFYCDRFTVNTQFFQNMICSSVSQPGLGISMRLLSNVISDCQSLDIKL
jgi:hypothetical protein